MAIEAQVKSTCEDCGKAIWVGDRIVLSGGAGWVHEVCPVKEPKRGEVCPECFTEKSLAG